MNELMIELRALERALQQPDLRLDEARLQVLLHADFSEVGRSGRVYDRAAMLALLAGPGSSAQDAPDIVADQFALRVLGPDAALLTYRSANRQADGSLARHTLRSSLWLRSDGRWQLLHHQGTAAETPW